MWFIVKFKFLFTGSATSDWTIWQLPLSKCSHPSEKIFISFLPFETLLISFRLEGCCTVYTEANERNTWGLDWLKTTLSTNCLPTLVVSCDLSKTCINFYNEEKYHLIPLFAENVLPQNQQMFPDAEQGLYFYFTPERNLTTVINFLLTWKFQSRRHGNLWSIRELREDMC